VEYQAGLAALELAKALQATPVLAPAPIGTALGSLATSPDARAAATRYRAYAYAQLRDLALAHARTASQRNPLQENVKSLVLEAQEGAS
jgi:hypothetical protein